MSGLSLGNGSIIKSIQRGVITITGGYTQTATVSAVNTSKAHLIFLGNGGASDVNPRANHARLTLTNSTTVTADRNSNVGNTDLSFELVEYY